MLTFIPDKNSNRPIYEQLYRYIRLEIESGQIPPESKLPSRRALAAHLKLSLTTIASAYAQLLSEGYIRSVPKSGYYTVPFERTAFSSLPQPKMSNGKSEKSAPVDFSVTPSRESELQGAHIAWDFRTNTTDAEKFPFSIWSSAARRVLRNHGDEILKSTHPQGLTPLRTEIAKHLRNYRGIDVCESAIIIGAGTEYLLGVAAGLCGHEKVFAYENPGYVKICSILQNAGLSTTSVKLDKKGLDVNALRSSKASCVHITPSHQFPTGIVMPVSRRAELLAWAGEKRGRYIIEDDYDSEFRFSGNPIQALFGLDATQKVIYMNTFSKSLAPAFRMGYIVLSDEMLRLFQTKYTGHACTVPSFDQFTLYEFMKSGAFERHLNRMRLVYKQKHDRLISEISLGPLGNTTEIIGADSGLHFLLCIDNGMSEKELISSAERHGVRVYGLSSFSAEPTETPLPIIVMGFSGLPFEGISPAVRALEKAWR